jgi:UDPglucose--hexose-1-phosphate uridylyltransferase
MSELRFDPIKSRWVIIDPDHPIRMDREPQASPSESAATCPLCPAHENACGNNLFMVPAKGGAQSDNGCPPWSVRVVPNGRPVLRTEEVLLRRGKGLYDVISGTGAHEVIVETPEHGPQLADLSVENIRDVFRAARARFHDLRRDTRLRYHLFIRSQGVEAGARIDHSHSQILATPEIPPNIRTELSNARYYHRRKERCIFCDLIREELEDTTRVVLDADRYVAFAPFASARPFELWLFPKRHASDFADSDDEELLHLASAVKDLCITLRDALEDPPFTLSLHTAPPMHPRPGEPSTWDSLPYDWHWHIEIVPRITRITGFDWDTGFSVNPVEPEQAAAFLRHGRRPKDT